MACGGVVCGSVACGGVVCGGVACGGVVCGDGGFVGCSWCGSGWLFVVMVVVL